MHKTRPRPETIYERFFIYPDRAGERELLDRRGARPTATPTVERVLEEATVTDLQAVPESVTVEDRVRDYVVDLGRATREDDAVEVGVSPRGVQ